MQICDTQSSSKSPYHTLAHKCHCRIMKLHTNKKSPRQHFLVIVIKILTLRIRQATKTSELTNVWTLCVYVSHHVNSRTHFIALIVTHNSTTYVRMKSDTRRWKARCRANRRHQTQPARKNTNRIRQATTELSEQWNAWRHRKSKLDAECYRN